MWRELRQPVWHDVLWCPVKSYLRFLLIAMMSSPTNHVSCYFFLCCIPYLIHLMYGLPLAFNHSNHSNNVISPFPTCRFLRARCGRNTTASVLWLMCKVGVGGVDILFVHLAVHDIRSILLQHHIWLSHPHITTRKSNFFVAIVISLSFQIFPKFAIAISHHNHQNCRFARTRKCSYSLLLQNHRLPVWTLPCSCWPSLVFFI